MTRILFILKYRENGNDYGSWNYGNGTHLSSGLYNSVRFVVDMLNAAGIEAKMVTVVDNNGIDAEVTKYKPSHCIIEAFWVVPEKFDVLIPLHPKVKWIVRDHSKTEFLAQEGMAFGWTAGYLARGVHVGCNSPESYRDMSSYADTMGFSPHLVEYLPNYYPLGAVPPAKDHRRFKTTNEIHIGCFGAIRPFKNQVMQALAALAFAEDMGGDLSFHINATRIEGNASPMLHNLRSIFKRFPNHTLVEHEWMSHEKFLVLCDQMDINMQVSFSETFNIVLADSVAVGVIAVGSKEIPYIASDLQADASSVTDIAIKLRKAWHDVHSGHLLHQTRTNLAIYDAKSKATWVEWSSHHHHHR